MSRKLQTILEALDSCLCEHIDQLETVIPNLEEDTDAFIADDIRELMEDIRGVINEE